MIAFECRVCERESLCMCVCACNMFVFDALLCHIYTYYYIESRYAAVLGMDGESSASPEVPQCCRSS